MKIGDKIVCDNGQVYSLERGYEGYTFSLVSENGEVIDSVMDYYLQECLAKDPDDFKRLGVPGENGEIEYVVVLELVSCSFKKQKYRVVIEFECQDDEITSMEELNSVANEIVGGLKREMDVNYIDYSLRLTPIAVEIEENE